MALVYRRLGSMALDKFVDSVHGSVRIVWIDGPRHLSAWEIVKTRQGTGLSLVDCTVLVVARSLGAKVFAFDNDFMREGLQVIP